MSEDTKEDKSIISDTDRKFVAKITSQILEENPTEEQIAKDLMTVASIRIMLAPSDKNDCYFEQLRKLSVFVALLITELRKAKTSSEQGDSK